MRTRDYMFRSINQVKEEYPKGTRILLIQMGDDPEPIESMTRGTVINVDDIGTVHCHFDNGRSLGLLVGRDNFRKLTKEEINEEMNFTNIKE